MDPVLIDIGPLTIRCYGAMIAAACLAGLWVAGKEAERKGIEMGIGSTYSGKTSNRDVCGVVLDKRGFVGVSKP